MDIKETDMLQRNEVGTREHILTWLASKDEAECFEWLSGECPAGQYSREFGDEHSGLNLEQLNRLAHIQPHTWGALYDRVCQDWT
jgi:hypothetical protein